MTCPATRRRRRKRTNAPGSVADRCRHTCRVNFIDSSSRSASPRRMPAARRGGAAATSRPACCQTATCANRASSRSASPSGVWCSSRKWLPQDSSRASASRHISSPSSRKSATRPARSSAWLSSPPAPGNDHVAPERIAQLGDLRQRVAQPPPSATSRTRPTAACRAARWNASAVCRRRDESSVSTRRATPAAASAKAG